MPTADETPEALRHVAKEPIARIALKEAEAAKAIGFCPKILKSLGENGPPVFTVGTMRLYPVQALTQWAMAMAAAKAVILTKKGEASADGVEAEVI